MKIHVSSQKKNPLMHRDEVVALVDHSGMATPSRKDMLPELAKQLHIDANRIIIDKIFNITGKMSCEARILVYEKADKIPKYKIEKMQGRMEKKKKAEAKPEKEVKEGVKEEGKEIKEKTKISEEKSEKPEEEKPKETPKTEEKIG